MILLWFYYDFILGGVFIVIFVGIGLAILTLVFEYVYYRDKRPSSVDSATNDWKANVESTISVRPKRNVNTQYVQ